MNGFRVKYPVDTFDGGLNTKYNVTVIGDNESPDCMNVVFDDVGAVGTRLGFSKFNSTAVGSFVGEGLFTTRFNSGNQTMCAWWNGCMYTAGTNGTMTTLPSAQSVYTAGGRVGFFMYQDLAFFGNGYNYAYKYNGVEFTRHTINVPASLPSVAITSAGVLNGEYKYKIAFVNSYVVTGDVTSNTTVLTAANQRIYLTGLPVGPTSYGVAARKIYRTVTSGTTYLLATTLSDNTTTVWEDNVADAALGAEAPSDNGQVPNWHFAVVLQERVFCVNPAYPQRVYYSDIGEPFTFPSANFRLINDGDSERITGLSVHGNSVVVHKEASIWIIYMEDTTPANWANIKTNSKYGSFSPWAIADYDNLQIFLGGRYGVMGGFYAFTGVGVAPDAIELQTTALYSDSQSDKIEPDIFDFNKTYVNKATAIEYKNKIWVAVPYDTASYNNRVYQYDFRRTVTAKSSGAWVPFTGINAAAFTIYEGNLYFQASTGIGRIYQLEVDQYNDDGVAIDSYYWTKEFSGQEAHSDWFKDWRFSNLVVGTLGDWYMDIYYRVDSDAGSGNIKQIDLNPGGALWGTMSWGDEWGGGITATSSKVYLGTSTGKRIQFKFTNQNTVDQAFKVLKMDLYYNLRSIR